MSTEIVEKKVYNLYPYQRELIDKLFVTIDNTEEDNNILFQLPTGGGKTIIFSEIAKRFIEEKKKKVLILTHRIELSKQTSESLASCGVDNFVISSQIREDEQLKESNCYVAMVETLNNRLSDDEEYIDNVGLVIVDEAHYNSFRKIFNFYKGNIDYLILLKI